MMKIVVPDDFPSVLTGTNAERMLRALGNVVVHAKRGAEQEAVLLARVSDADVVLALRAYSKFPESVLEQCPRLKLISVWGTGTDNIDLEACKRHGIAVASTPGVNARAVAEHTMALMLAIARRIPAMDAAVRDGGWPCGTLDQLEGKTLGLIGLGAIGSRVATLAAPFGMTILASTRGPDDGRAAVVGARHVSLETLLVESDIVSLHLRLSPDTRGYLDHVHLALMKPTAFLINTARAALVDQDALIDALREGRIAGAALDVFHEEPIMRGDPILDFANVVLTPHNAGTTPEVVTAGLVAAVQNVELFIRG